MKNNNKKQNNPEYQVTESRRYGLFRNLPFYKKAGGQESFVFQLLIGAIVGMIIIAIVYVLIQKMDDQKSYLSDESLMTNIKYAVKAPTGEPYIVENVILKKGAQFTKKYLSEETNMPEYCLDLTSKKSVITEDDLGGLVIEQDIESDVKITCTPGDTSNNCDTNCNIEFG